MEHKLSKLIDRLAVRKNRIYSRNQSGISLRCFECDFARHHEYYVGARKIAN